MLFRSACLARGAAAQVFKPGNHGSTFGGNPLACAAALTTLQVIEEQGLLQAALDRGQQIRDGLASALHGLTGVREIRGRGLMLGIELDRPCGELVTRALERGLLINVTVDHVIRLLPPLVISEAEAAQVVDILVPLVRDFLAQPRAQAAKA